jgi:hypothetical protein
MLCIGPLEPFQRPAGWKPRWHGETPVGWAVFLQFPHFPIRGIVPHLGTGAGNSERWSGGSNLAFEGA